MGDNHAALFQCSDGKKVILLDIEGTTTSIDFVKDVLFVKAREYAEEFLQKNYEEDAMKHLISNLVEQIKSDIELGVTGATALPEDETAKQAMISAIVKNVNNMIDSDRKCPSLKALQGRIWREGYEAGTIKGHVYEDVVATLNRWKEEGKMVCIYSSGSVEAQKLLFQHSCFGNLLHNFAAHFDTNIGHKVDWESYDKISNHLKVDSKSVLFLTDVEKEAIAASTAGMDVILLIRPGNKPLSKEALEKFMTATSFKYFDSPPGQDF